MDARIPRRQFLKTVPAAGALVYATTSGGDTAPHDITGGVDDRGFPRRVRGIRAF